MTRDGAGGASGPADPVFRQLGRHIAGPGAWSAELAAAATARFLDTLGVAIQGAQCDVGRIVAAYCGGLGASGPSTLLTGGSGPPAVAALCNGAAAHAQDFDDATTVILSGHLSAVLVPAALAVGEAGGASGPEVLMAFALGCDVEMALADVVNPHHYEAGFHPTATLGALGAAAVTARLLGCTPESAARSLALAASMASGIKANFGTMTKPFHAGWAAHSGVTAGYLAHLGLTANPAAFEAPLGFGAVYGGADWQSRDPVAQLEKGPVLLWPGVAVPKLWPCCRSIHSTIEAVLKLRVDHDIRLRDVASVRAGLHARRLGHVNRPAPATGADARFSTQYCTAVALREGAVAERHFAEAAVADPEIREFLTRCEVAADDRETGRGGEMDGRDFGAAVRILLRDGRCLEQRVDVPKGDGGNRIAPGDLVAKFTACAGPVLGSAGTSALLRQVERLARMAHISELTEALRGSQS